MSQSKTRRMASNPMVVNMPSGTRLTSRSRSYHPISEQQQQQHTDTRRPSGGSAILNSPTMPTTVAAPKLSRTSKTSQRHVVLPSEPQTRPLPDEVPEGVIPTYDVRSEGERMSKEERQRAGYSRMTAYSVAEGIRMKHLSAFLKREHAVVPRVFDEAIYAVRKNLFYLSLWRRLFTLCSLGILPPLTFWLRATCPCTLVYIPARKVHSFSNVGSRGIWVRGDLLSRDGRGSQVLARWIHILIASAWKTTRPTPSTTAAE